MAEKIIMPKQGLQMTEGTIIEWLFREGDKVVAGEPLFEMETDKLAITIDSTVSGTLLKIVADVGATVPITEVIAIIGEPEEDVAGLLCKTDIVSGPDTLAEPDTSAEPETDPNQAVTAAQGSATATDRVFISPRAKARADELNVDYTTVAGSAPDGMIIERDILAAKKALSGTSPDQRKAANAERVDFTGITDGKAQEKNAFAETVTSIQPDGEDIMPVKGMRKIIAKRMKQSLNENAQTTHRVSVRMNEVVSFRLAMNKTVSFNDLIAYATVQALGEYPAINAELTNAGVWRKRFVNLGIAVDIKDGLIVPVVKNAQNMSLSELSAEIKRLAEKAREGKLTPEEFTGGSFTISNLGMFGLEEFVAIINPPESGILAVGAIEDTPVAVEGKLEICPVMKLTLSYDHRVIDGAPAAQFLVKIKQLLEYPYLMLLKSNKS